MSCMPEIQFLGEKTLFNCQAIVCCKWAYCWSIMSIDNLSYESWRFLVKFIAGTCTMLCTYMCTWCMYLCMHHRTGCPNKVILYQAGEDKSVYMHVHVEYHPSVIRIHGRIVTGRIIVSSVGQTTCEWSGTGC